MKIPWKYNFHLHFFSLFYENLYLFMICMSGINTECTVICSVRASLINWCGNVMYKWDLAVGTFFHGRTQPKRAADDKDHWALPMKREGIHLFASCSELTVTFIAIATTTSPSLIFRVIRRLLFFEHLFHLLSLKFSGAFIWQLPQPELAVAT